ncbi:uncharacterized protein ACWYII_042223 [Salvelinus alpinus]
MQFGTKTQRLSHGRQLKIYLPKSAEKLEFTPAAQPLKKILYWNHGAGTARGKVSGTGTDRSWYLDQVTYNDQGTYVQSDYWNKEISSLKVSVTSCGILRFTLPPTLGCRPASMDRTPTSTSESIHPSIL